MFVLCGLAACSDTGELPPPKIGKALGETCQVTTECAAEFRCVDGLCADMTCTTASDCEGDPPGGCAAWQCIGAICQAACYPDAGEVDAARPDSARPDAGTPDAFLADAVGEDAFVEDAGGPDAEVGDSSDPDLGPRDTGVMCNPTARAPAMGDLLINEIHADPDAIDGDANQDGAMPGADDEFIEIANISTDTLELNGVVVSDMLNLRHTFAARTLSCGQVVVVFAGGDPNHPNWDPSWVVATTGALTLNNAGDQIRVGTNMATPDDLISETYGGNAGNDQSIVRTTELTPASPFILHTAHPQAGTRLYSPGVRVDGTPF